MFKKTPYWLIYLLINLLYYFFIHLLYLLINLSFPEQLDIRLKLSCEHILQPNWYLGHSILL